MRVGSQLTFCSPDKILHRTAVEQDENNIITGFFSLDNEPSEPENTLFFDGIVSSGLVSLKQTIPEEIYPTIFNEYQYLDFSENITLFNIRLNGKPLILDFGTNLPDKFNSLLPDFYRLLSGLSIFDIIAACSYNPSVISGYTASLTEGFKTGLILWENTDLVHKKLSVTTKIRELSRFTQTGKTKLY